jgi:hypothetical protein
MAIPARGLVDMTEPLTFLDLLAAFGLGLVVGFLLMSRVAGVVSCKFDDEAQQ